MTAEEVVGVGVRYRQRLRSTSRLVVHGEAFVLVFDLHTQPGDPTDLHVEAEKIIAKQVKKMFKGYRLEDLEVNGATITARCFGVDDRRAGLMSYVNVGDTWAKAVDKVLEDSRRDLCTYLSRQAAAARVRVRGQWLAGSGVEALGGSVNEMPDVVVRDELYELKRYERQLTIMKIVALSAFALSILGTILFAIVLQNELIVILGPAYSVLFIFGALTAAVRQRTLRDEIRELQGRLDLNDLLDDRERFAHKLFQVNSLELKRYHDQALNQRGFVFGLGVVCVFIGFALTGLTLLILFRTQDASLGEQIVIAALGAASGILANFVAVIFLKMFSDIVRSTGDFHNGLLATHHMHFGNVIAAKISDKNIRDDAISHMAKSVGNRAPEPTGGTSDSIQK